MNANPFEKVTMVQFWSKALGLSMGPINEERVASGLPVLKESDASLTALAQAAADKMAAAGKFVEPEIKRSENTLIMAMTLSGETRINEYAFLLNDSKSPLICLAFIH